MRAATFIVLILFLSGCFSTKEVRRANRANKKLEKLVQKFPELQQADTLRGIIQYTEPEINFQTTVPITDTIKIAEPKTGLNLTLIKKNDSLHVEIKKPPKTVSVPYEIENKRVISTPTKPQTYKHLFFILLFALIIVVFLYRRG